MSLPIVGAKISLISKSNIRFVGILHSINHQESSVSLENVCSFGTEGRAATPQQEIPPQPNVFPLIVFKGSDVKDLKVEDSNPQPPPAQTQWGGYGYPQQQFGFPQYVTPPAPHFGGTPPQHSQHFGGPQYWQSPNQTQIPQMQNMNHGQMHQLPPNQSQMPPGMNNGNPGWGFPTRPSPSPAQAAAARLSPGTQTQKPQLKQSLQQQTPKPVAISKPSALLPNTSTPAVETITFGKVGVWDKPQKSQLALQVNKDIAADEFNDQKHVKSNSGGKKINLKQVRANSGRNGNQRDGEKSYQKDGGANGNGENAKRHDRERDTKTVEDGASGGESNTSPLIPGQERKPKPRKPKMVVPTEEFDFESSNAKFEKDEDDLHVEPVYTKSSFFDDISTDIKDRSMNETNDWREKMKEERQTNMETFGQTGIRRGRGRGRGSRGRGGSVRGKGTGNAPVGAVSSSGQEVA